MGAALILAVLLVLLVLWTKREGKKQRAEAAAWLNAKSEEMRREREAHPGDLKVVATRAFWYQGKTYFTPNRKRRLVAIDLHIENGGPWVNIGHFEVINARTGRSYGDHPHIVFLKADGSPEPDDVLVPSSSLVRLIYQVPSSCAEINIGCWGSHLLAAPALVEAGV